MNPANVKASNRLLQHIQKIDIETGLEPVDYSRMPTSAKVTAPDPHIGDLLKLSEVKMQQLEKENKQLGTKNTDLVGEVCNVSTYNRRCAQQLFS